MDPNATKTATFSALRCLKRPCPESARSSSHCSPRPAGGLRRCRPGAGLARPDHLLRGAASLLNPVTRPHALEQLQHLGVKALRVELNWETVAPDPTSATKPTFEATNPASYDWGQYAMLLAEAKQLGWPVLLTVTAPAPRWATSNQQAPYITRPDPKDFEEFMTAVAREFGSEVSIYSIWNEPNEPVFLMPQWNSNGTPASGRIYRGLYQAGYAGLQAARARAHPQGALRRNRAGGYDTVSERNEGAKALRHPVAPLAFMREALCLNAKYKKAGSCSELQMTGYAHHAYTLPAGPYYVPPQRNDVVDRRALAAVERAQPGRTARMRSRRTCRST